MALEKKEGEQNQGVQIAMYFKRKASSVTTTMGILADKALLKFVQTTFGIPESASKADLDIQVRNLEKHLNVADLQDPKKVDKLIQRFSAMWDVNNTSIATTVARPDAFRSVVGAGGIQRGSHDEHRQT